MSMTNEPCAYCGKSNRQREKGHVIQRSLYPSAVDPKIQRPTVPECMECKKIWQVAENQFRTILVVAGEPNPHVMEQWNGPILRSFDKPSGQRWAQDIVEQMTPVQTAEGPRYAVYPGRDPRVMLVIRKIIRGLCHYHNLGTAVEDHRVFATFWSLPIPAEIREKMTLKSFGTLFFQYWYYIFDQEDPELHSAWVLRFYDRCEFIGVVSASD